MAEDVNLNISYLETIHNLMELTQKHVDLLGDILKRDDYSGVSVKSWHAVLNNVRNNMVLLQGTVKILVEEDLKNEEKMNDIMKDDLEE